jgi:hypothetical protein
MDDNGNIIYYLVLGAIYLLSRVFGKKKKPVAKPVQRPVRRPVQEDRDTEPEPIEAPTAQKEEAPLSFEEILRELSGVPQPKPVADPRPVEAPTNDYPEFKPAPYLENRPQPSYALDDMDAIAGEMKEPKPFGSERLAEPNTMDIKRKVLTFQRGDNYTIKEQESTDYLDVLNEQDGPAKAFVWSQIFNRKYD